MPTAYDAQFPLLEFRSCTHRPALTKARSDAVHQPLLAARVALLRAASGSDRDRGPSLGCRSRRLGDHELGAGELREMAALAHQLVEATRFDDAAALEYQDSRRVAD